MKVFRVEVYLANVAALYKGGVHHCTLTRVSALGERRGGASKSGVTQQLERGAPMGGAIRNAGLSF